MIPTKPRGITYSVPDEPEEIGIWISLSEAQRLVELTRSVADMLENAVKLALEELQDRPILTVVKKIPPERGH
jgi:hypothetical protein